MIKEGSCETTRASTYCIIQTHIYVRCSGITLECSTGYWLQQNEWYETKHFRCLVCWHIFRQFALRHYMSYTTQVSVLRK